jgi:imidazolonepropionase-like amidohydrolase
VFYDGGAISMTGGHGDFRAAHVEGGPHGHGLCAHAHTSSAIRRCVEYGVRGIEHGALIDKETAVFMAANDETLLVIMRGGEIIRTGLDTDHDGALGRTST